MSSWTGTGPSTASGIPSASSTISNCACINFPSTMLSISFNNSWSLSPDNNSTTTARFDGASDKEQCSKSGVVRSGCLCIRVSLSQFFQYFTTPDAQCRRPSCETTGGPGSVNETPFATRRPQVRMMIYRYGQQPGDTMIFIDVGSFITRSSFHYVDRAQNDLNQVLSPFIRHAPPIGHKRLFHVTNNILLT